MAFIIILLIVFAAGNSPLHKFKEKRNIQSLELLKNHLEPDENIIKSFEFSHTVILTVILIISFMIYIFLSLYFPSVFHNILSLFFSLLIFLLAALFLYLTVKIRFGEMIVMSNKSLYHIYTDKIKNKIPFSEIKKVIFFGFLPPGYINAFIIIKNHWKLKFFYCFENSKELNETIKSMLQKGKVIVISKKIIFLSIIVLIGLFYTLNFIKEIPNYKFGYITESKALKYNRYQLHRYIFELNDGNILLLGRNMPSSYPGISDCKYCVNAKFIPSEIYNIKTNTIKEITFPSNIYYIGNGILLKNNKLLLTHAYEFNKPEYKENRAYPYDSIAVINLDNMTVEKVIKKELNKTYKPFPNSFALLFGNNKVLLSQDVKREVIDLNNNTSKILKDFDLPHKSFNAIIPSKDEKLLLFNRTYKNDGEFDYVYEYDYLTETIKRVGKVMKRNNDFTKKISDDKIVILGGRHPEQNFKRYNEIEIYDINTNESKIVSNMIIDRCPTADDGFDAALFAGRYLFMAGGKCRLETVYGIKTDKNAAVRTEILDLETLNHTLSYKTAYSQRHQTMITLSNGNVLILNPNKGRIRILKQWEKKK